MDTTDSLITQRNELFSDNLGKDSRDPSHLKLLLQSSFWEQTLHDVGSVEAVDAIGAKHTFLHAHGTVVSANHKVPESDSNVRWTQSHTIAPSASQFSQINFD